jgi:hypothetical protein
MRPADGKVARRGAPLPPPRCPPLTCGIDIQDLAGKLPGGLGDKLGL